MGEIQPFTEEHADGVARLYFRAVRGQNRPPGETLPRYFTELHLSNPWASPEMPALVYLEKGNVVGTLGILPRPMEFRGRPILAACMTLFMVDPELGRGQVAIQLVGRAFKGPQDFIWTDGASGPVTAIWSALGGHSADLYAFNWVRILKPFGAGRLGLERIGHPLLKRLAGVVTVPLDVLVSRVPSTPLRPPVSPYRSTVVTADELLGCIAEIGWRESLKPSYSSPSFQWLMREAAKTRHGELRMLTVANQEGARCGWFIYYASPSGAALVLQIGVRRRENFESTLVALFQDAWQQGSVIIRGASIPQYLTTLTEQQCFFRHPHDRVVVHSRNPEIASAIRLGEAALTRLDGIGWLRFARENWD